MTTRQPTNPSEEVKKQCRRCEAEKPLGDFYTYLKSPDKRESICKACRLEDAPTLQSCDRCGEQQPQSQFHPTRFGRKTTCRECESKAVAPESTELQPEEETVKQTTHEQMTLSVPTSAVRTTLDDAFFRMVEDVKRERERSTRLEGELDKAREDVAALQKRVGELTYDLQVANLDIQEKAAKLKELEEKAAVGILTPEQQAAYDSLFPQPIGA